MTVTNWTLRLYWKRHPELTVDRTLNADDDKILRETLEQLVAQRMGPKHHENLADWSAEVLNPKTHRRAARVSIDSGGRTRVKR